MIDLRESKTYKIIHDRAKAEGIRETILRLGKKKLGKPSAKVVRVLNAIADEACLTH
jgi:hypothetical protein